jgi:hypothetical protein
MMKGFPQHVDGPLGPWFKKVRAAVGAVSVGDSRERVVDVLGPPDETLHEVNAMWEETVAAGASQVGGMPNPDPRDPRWVYW